MPILIPYSHTHYNPNDYFVLFYLLYLYVFAAIKCIILSKINAHESLQLPALCGLMIHLFIAPLFSPAEDFNPSL